MDDLLQKMKNCAEALRTKVKGDYEYGVILGSGLSAFGTQMEVHCTIPYSEVPGFPASTVKGHQGSLIFGETGGKRLVCMNGRFHYYEGYSMQDVTFPIRVMKLLGVHTLMISNAAGGMNEAFEVGDLMILTDHIYLHPEHPLRGKNHEELGPRFLNMEQAYDPALVKAGLQIALEHKIRCHKGVYVALQGPTFETPAEYRWLHHMGADAVGMSTAPEVVVARHMGIRCFALSVISDIGYPAEKADHVSHEFVLQKAAEAEPNMTKIISELLLKL